MSSKEPDVWFRFVRAHRTVIREIERRLADAGLPPYAWYDALWGLESGPDGTRRMHELADVLAIEQAGTYQGRYFVLLGHLSPIDGIGPEDIGVDQLIKLLQQEPVKEVILATNPTVEGDGTALYISNLLSEFPVRITRLARGITAGSILEYANKEVLADAITGRQQL
jgi:hypothetical protein